MKRAMGLVLLIVIAAAAVWWLRARAEGRSTVKTAISVAAVTRGPLAVMLPVNGVLESARVTPVTAEVEGQIVQMCENNRPVAPGDLVFQLDTKELVDERDELQQSLADARENLSKSEADSAVAISQAESDVARAAEALELTKAKTQAAKESIAAQVQFAEGELARAERELSRSQRLADLNYIAGTKLQVSEKAYRAKAFDRDSRLAEQQDVAKKTEEEVQAAQTALELAQQDLASARADARLSAQSGRANIAENQRRLDEVNRKIEQCRVVAPAAGLAVMETNNESWPERRPYRVGDRVAAGYSPVRVYDLTQMQVRCQIGEMDIARVHQGQEAFVMFPGDPNRRYHARVAAVEELARESNVWEGGTPGKKVFGILIGLDRTDPARLRPGMTVDLEVILGKLPDVLSVPIRAVFAEKGGACVYRRRDNGFERVPVVTGTRNDLVVEVRGGVNPGDEVALVRPRVPQVGER